MKGFKWLAILGCLLSNAVFAQATTDTTPDAYGSISATELLTQYPEFASEYASYQPTTEALQQAKQLQGLTVVVLFGTWCHDSVREVPRLLKLLDGAEVPLQALQLQAVNRQKQHPEQLNAFYELRYTPTIIVLEQEQELGRIIEKPTQSLAEDLAAIASKR